MLKIRIIMRECRCGRLFEPLEPFDLICDACWEEAMQPGDDDEDDNESEQTSLSYDFE